MKRSLILSALLFAAPAAGQEPAVAITNAAVETLAAAGRLERATVVVRGGKVEAVGPDVKVPEGATVIDAAGGTVLPGLIDPYFEVSVATATADTGPRTVVIRGRVLQVPAGPAPRATGFTRVADNFYPYDPEFKPLPRAGLTRLNLVTGGVGQAAVVRVTPREPGRMLDRPDGAAYAAVTNQTDSLDQVRQRLAPVGGRGRGGAPGGPTGRAGPRPGGAAPPAGAQLWQDVRDGKAPLIASAANAAAVVHLMQALAPHKDVRLVLYAAGDALAEAVDALKGRNVTVILRPTLELVPNTRDRFNPARLLHEAGVEVAFSLTARPPATGQGPTFGRQPDATDSGIADQDFPLFPVAVLVKTGLPRQIALEALTKRPAAILGLDKTHGTIEPGKAADLLLYSGDPLDPNSRLRRVLIDGRTAYAN
jgi:hypothetical protein